MIHKDHVTFYPKAGLLKQGKSLYNVRDLGISESGWRDITPKKVQVQMMIHIDPFDRDYMMRVFKIFTPTSSVNVMLLGVYVSPLFQEVFPLVHVRRIQKATRGYLRRKFEERALSLMMALHPRLGGGNVLTSLPVDIFRSILIKRPSNGE